MDPITQHHYTNLANYDHVRNEDGSISTVRTIIMGDGENEYLIPTVWEGKILSDEEAFDRAMESGIEWPSMPAGEDGIKRLEEVDAKIHEGFEEGLIPTKEAQDILRGEAENPNAGIMGREYSPRPKSRPETVLTYDDLDDMSRVAYMEARGEGPQGLDAVFGVMLNRLNAEDFPDQVKDILVEGEFEPMNGLTDPSQIDVPEDDLADTRQALIDYIQLGEDASGGRTFFQNEKLTSERGTHFTGADPLRIGDHTFTRSYKDGPIVEPSYFAHGNVKVVDGDTYTEKEDGEGVSWNRVEFAGGGLVSLEEGKKAILTLEGRDIAEKKFQLDEDKADLNGDGQLSPYEKMKGEAVQKAIRDDELIEAAHGGMPCGCEGECECGEMDGMMPGSYYDFDEISGNAVPTGSLMEEVRDDVPAMLSEGEYVLPADVVRWHGLKHIQDMMLEAKAGLMSMDMMGQLHEMYETEEEEDLEEEGIEEDTEEEEIETEEGNDIEVATVETEEETLEPSEDEEDDEDAKVLSYAYKSTPKTVFIR